MTTQSIQESGMTFGPFNNGQCFHIEKSRVYANIQQGVKIAEFLLLKIKNRDHPVVWIVEAKSSTPRPETQPNFDDFIAEIREKFVNALSLGLASCLKRHQQADNELPDQFKTLNLSLTDVKFVLVINGHQESWLPPVQDALRKALHATVKTWAFSPPSIVVLNEHLAKQHGLIPTGGGGAV